MVGLLTLDSRIYNYGGFLQEMALQDAINSLGYECEIIDYEVSQEFNTFSLKRGIKNFSFDKIKKKQMKASRGIRISGREIPGLPPKRIG